MPRTGKKKKSALASDYQYSDDDEDVINDSEAHVESFFEDAPRAKRAQIADDEQNDSLSGGEQEAASAASSKSAAAAQRKTTKSAKSAKKSNQVPDKNKDAEHADDTNGAADAAAAVFSTRPLFFGAYAPAAAIARPPVSVFSISAGARATAKNSSSHHLASALPDGFNALKPRMKKARAQLDDFVDEIFSALHQAGLDLPEDWLDTPLVDGLEAPKGSSLEVIKEFKHARQSWANAHALERAAHVTSVMNELDSHVLHLTEKAAKHSLLELEQRDLEACRGLILTIFSPQNRVIFAAAVQRLTELSKSWIHARLFKLDFMAGESNAADAAIIFDKRVAGHLPDKDIAERATLKKAIRKLGRDASTSSRASQRGSGASVSRGASFFRGRGRGHFSSSSSSSSYNPYSTFAPQPFFFAPPPGFVPPSAAVHPAPWLQFSGGDSSSFPSYNSRGAPAARGRGGRGQYGAGPH